MIYLDSAATTLQKPLTVSRAVRQAMATMTSPGRGEYGPSARAAGTLLACRELVRGASASVSVDVRLVAENAILTAASSVILAHNHPSGVALPSAEDEESTRRLAETMKLVGVVVSDHIVMAGGDYVSMRECGMLR